MNKWPRIAVTSAVVLALVAPAFAQSAGTGTTTGPSSVEPAAAARGGVIVAQETGQSLSSDLVGMKVIGANEDSIGAVSDLIVADGRIAGAVLDVGGFLGLGAKEVGVSWDSLTVTEVDGTKVATLPLSKEQLSSMPEFKTLADIRAEASRKAPTGTSTGISGGGTPKQ